ncbi:hypothetical protein IGI04_043112 [Brassica rapa subsp. trilocularis]|uniref:Uncharacterized protein n=1 Tax=Brassica rapa subsp. trilocularis TaxID=1813537 RepID=A0ABQ7KJ86_BRACM|nr:hypothetical protein IGI04_043112 [Brassica rapa subsp. trilocularis]
MPSPEAWGALSFKASDGSRDSAIPHSIAFARSFIPDASAEISVGRESFRLYIAALFPPSTFPTLPATNTVPGGESSCSSCHFP